MDKDDTTKVADFGLSRKIVEEVYEARKVCNQLPEGQTCDMTLIIHEMLRKKGNATQQKDKATQHNSPKVVIFRRKKLPWVGFEPTTVRLLGDALTH